MFSYYHLDSAKHFIYQDSEDDELEETEEEFMDRYAKAAAELEENIVEGDLEDEANQLDLGKPQCNFCFP